MIWLYSSSCLPMHIPWPRLMFIMFCGGGSWGEEETGEMCWTSIFAHLYPLVNKGAYNLSQRTVTKCQLLLSVHLKRAAHGAHRRPEECQHRDAWWLQLGDEISRKLGQRIGHLLAWGHFSWDAKSLWSRAQEPSYTQRQRVLISQRCTEPSRSQTARLSVTLAGSPVLAKGGITGL